VKQEHVIRVMIVDDHDMVRTGLSVFLEAFDDLELVGDAKDGETAVELCHTLHPDVVLMDLVMPGMSGVAAIRAIRQTHPDIQIIALTSFSEQHLVREALQTGAVGYLLKNVSIDELADAIRAAHAGRPTLTPEVLRVLVDTSAPPTPDSSLTPREVEVLELIVAGLNNKEIAERLIVSRSTVKTHVSNILAKLGTSNRAEAAALAVQRHLIT
jgi:NarL family two-component system response regulator LiaR